MKTKRSRTKNNNLEYMCGERFTVINYVNEKRQHVLLTES